VSLKEVDEDEDSEESNLMYTLCMTNAILLNRMGGTISISQQEWEAASEFSISSRMEDDVFIISITSRSSKDVN
jgi:hypothetical protein